MCVLEPKTRPLGERFAEFNSDSKILFNLWGWLWLSMDRILNFLKVSRDLRERLKGVMCGLFQR
nr:hypothetical protein [Leptospira interrogans]